MAFAKVVREGDGEALRLLSLNKESLCRCVLLSHHDDVRFNMAKTRPS